MRLLLYLAPTRRRGQQALVRRSHLLAKTKSRWRPHPPEPDGARPTAAVPLITIRSKRCSLRFPDSLSRPCFGSFHMSFSATGTLPLGGCMCPTSCIPSPPRISSDRSRLLVVCVLGSHEISLVLGFLFFLTYARGRATVASSLATVLFCSRLFSQSSRARFTYGVFLRVLPCSLCASLYRFSSPYALEALVPICLLSVLYCRFLPSNVGIHRGLGAFLRVLSVFCPMGLLFVGIASDALESRESLRRAACPTRCRTPPRLWWRARILSLGFYGYWQRRVFWGGGGHRLLSFSQGLRSSCPLLLCLCNVSGALGCSQGA